MQQLQTPASSHRLAPIILTGVVVLSLVALAGLTFGGWAIHGEKMLNAIWQAGLSWCG